MSKIYYDWIRTLKYFMEAYKKFNNLPVPIPTHIKTPDGKNHKLENLFKELEEYEERLQREKLLKKYLFGEKE